MNKRSIAALMLILGASLSLTTAAFAEDDATVNLKAAHTGQMALSDFNSGAGLVCDKAREKHLQSETSSSGSTSKSDRASRGN